MNEQMSTISESCRALGNISRYSSVSTRFQKDQSDRLLLALMDSPDVNIVQHVTGILINFTLSSDCSHLFFKDGDHGFLKLLSAMTEFSDWFLATLIIQLLWNILRFVENKVKITAQATCIFFHSIGHLSRLSLLIAM